MAIKHGQSFRTKMVNNDLGDARKGGETSSKIEAIKKRRSKVNLPRVVRKKG